MSCLHAVKIALMRLNSLSWAQTNKHSAAQDCQIFLFISMQMQQVHSVGVKGDQVQLTETWLNWMISDVMTEVKSIFRLSLIINSVFILFLLTSDYYYFFFFSTFGNNSLIHWNMSRTNFCSMYFV